MDSSRNCVKIAEGKMWNFAGEVEGGEKGIVSPGCRYL